jgi:hypothetical protein
VIRHNCPRFCSLAFVLVTTTACAEVNAESTVTQTERAFWICDYVATTKGINATPIEGCATVTETLKNERFGGDFLKLLGWWRERKAAEHERLSR